MKSDLSIPADIAQHAHAEYEKNYRKITHDTNRLLLFSCDQKVEHLNRDFYGPNIDPADNDPAHMFTIAARGYVGAFATHLGLIAQYGMQFPSINYIVKMNGKTDLVKTEQRDPLSRQLWTIDQLVSFKKNSGLSIVGIGYTLYPGSVYEPQMLHEAAQLIYEAHQHGLIAILWMYPRGNAVKNERDGSLIAGVAGLAAALGADFAKINTPTFGVGVPRNEVTWGSSNKNSYEWLQIAAQAAGKTKLIISGGAKTTTQVFLQELYDQIHKGNVAGCATGRNIHQRSLQEAVALTQAMHGIIYENKSVEEVINLIKGMR